jgi:NAD(P)-dependent dehydrogenase (short-subunit alcohol dehydrogenase family)
MPGHGAPQLRIIRPRKAITMATWLITGCSTGLGRALASAALDRGERVAVTARDAAKVEDLARSHPDTALALPLDVTDHARVRDVVRAAQERFGTIDVLVNNAGHGYRAAVEEAADDQVQELFATNFFGPAALIQAVLPGMRERRSGTIVNISSGGARSYPVGAGHYVATKAALEALTASLRKEVEPLGITVMVVEPGAFRTNYKCSLIQAREEIGDYAVTVGTRRRQDRAEHGLQPGDPARAAQAIITAVDSPDPPLLLVLAGRTGMVPRFGAGVRRGRRRLGADQPQHQLSRLGTSDSPAQAGQTPLPGRR